MSDTQLIYVYDPMCSWCWGYKNTWQRLQEKLVDVVDIDYRVGGLAPDSNEPMALSMQQFLQQTWHRIAEQTGAQFNFDFWQQCQPKRSTYAACRAILVARSYNKEHEMLEAIQHGYYLNAQNPSELNTLAEFATLLAIPKDEFMRLIQSDEIEQQLQNELNFVRQLPIQGFPSLVLKVQQQYFSIAIDYQNVAPAYQQILNYLNK